LSATASDPMTQFRKRGNLPQLRSYGDQRRTSPVVPGKQGRIGQLGPTSAGRKIPSIWLAIGLAFVTLLLVVAAPIWLPAVSWFIPDRYVMAYAPEPIQHMIFQINVNEQVPTPATDTTQSAAAVQLLETLSPTATPTFGPVQAGGPGYVQPTKVAIAPTPTFTPVFSIDVAPGARDAENEADLSHVTKLLEGFDWEQQGYNNCGPASIRVLMSYWGVDFTEAEAAAYLKPEQEDPNVRPDEIVKYVEQYGYQALIRENGSFDVIRNFILAGYPVLIETGYDPEPDTIGWTSHYLTIVGYSDEGFIAMDTYRRPNWFYPYNEVDHYWRQFNRHYIIVFRPDQYAAVASIIGEDIDNATMYENALATARAESSLNREDPYAWYNLGSNLVNLGRYEDAVLAFDEARRLGLPSRFMWYQFAAYEAYLKVGRNQDVIDLADFVLQKKASEEAYYYKGLALAAMGEISRARVQLSLAVSANKNFEAAQQALDALEE
jgi:tetratricopeptide (TPR) repeat protein